MEGVFVNSFCKEYISIRFLEKLRYFEISTQSKSALLERSTMASSPPAEDLRLCNASEGESRLASVVYDLSNQVQLGMESMLSKISEIDQNSASIMEDFERSRASTMERKKALEEEKEKLEKAAYHVFDLFSRK